MKYTKYFSGILNVNGVPHLEVSSTKKMFNVIHLEGRVCQLKELRETIKESANPKQFDYHILKLEQQLDRITNSQPPNEFFQNLIGTFEP